jgi:hypothetical protein
VALQVEEGDHMKKYRDWSEGTQGLVVSLALGVGVLAIALVIKFIYALL